MDRGRRRPAGRRRGERGRPGRAWGQERGALPAPHYTEEAAAAGLVHAYQGEFFYFVGGGVAVFDCDGDGRQDLYLAGGEEPAALFRNRSPVGGALAFDPVPSPVTDMDHVVGAYPIDIDADGNVDLAVLRVGENVLLRGMGGCAFERANEAWGFDGGAAWTTAFAASWEDPDAIADPRVRQLPEAGDGRRWQLRLRRQSAGPAGRLGPAVRAAEALSPSYCSLSMLFSDWDRSGRRDLRVSNDRQFYRPPGEEQLWRMTPGAAPRLYTRDEGWQVVHIWGMGIASYDLTGDGYPEVFLTSQSDNRLQTLADGPGQPRYRDIAIERGATAHEPYTGDVDLPSTAWHSEFADVNNDGDIDLFVAKGNVEELAGYATRDPSNLLIGQADGTFVEGGMDAGIVSFARARGAALADLNLDGMLDLVIVNRRENVGLYRNVGSGTADDPEPMGHWLTVRLRAGGRQPRRDRRLGGGHRRRPGHAAGGHRRRRPRRRAAGLDPLRAG